MSLIKLSSKLMRVVPRSPVFANVNRQVHRWVGPTLRELKCRREKMGPEAELPRSGHSDWNYSAEIFAFGKRLSEQFDSALLQQAFTHRSFIAQEEQKQTEVGIESPQLGLKDNRELTDLGERLIHDYVEAFLLTVLPKLPYEGIRSISDKLTATENLANISKHLGTRDIILAADFPVGDQLLADTLKAVVGALHESSGEERVYLFIRDFVCTQLNQQDVNEYLHIEKPLDLLKQYCRDQKLGDPEPRSIGLVGKNTLLAAYNVAIYCNKKYMGAGFGEDVQTAIDEAARDCLRQLFGTELDMKPINFSTHFNEVAQNLKHKASERL
ncbi:39S ribosomal protein L44, mitochondrial [Toxorhynchites rutilus septentrionalis]|uniref:39S ribosomal protein L44, mitochondrial n=1 Tax=Toxorhynchites rutilus septentrionalis TaxID=329112 RepID=UPI0024796065|nr:39S ribosomal protein L44, mitochondrial [Toxorhynchites rutilus septentrionalis]